jgi:very-short-patch-repair endonuclease
LHSAIGRVVRDADDTTPRFAWPKGTIHDEPEFGRLKDLARRLGLARAAVVGVPLSFDKIRQSHWTNVWQESLATAASELPQRIEALITARDRAIETSGLSLAADDARAAELFAEFLELLLSAYGRDFRFAFAPDFNARVDAGRRAITLIREYRLVESQLSVAFAPEATRRLNLAQFEADLATANAKFWLLSNFARKGLARRLAQQGGAASLPNLDFDLPRLHQLGSILSELDALGPATIGIPGWNGVASDISEIEASLDLAERLRSRIASFVETSDELISKRRQVAELIVNANELLAPGGAVAVAHSRLTSELPRYEEASARLAQLASANLSEASFEDQIAIASAICEYQPKLNAWCNWRRVREEAVDAGLLPLVEAIERGSGRLHDAQDMFETAYARWFAVYLIDDEPKLSELITDVHMSDIEAYRRLEDRLSELSVRYIRAKLCGRIPDKNNVSRKDGYGVLKHQLQLQRRHKPVRQLATEMGEAFTSLAPCMLMSPLSIAQYLPANHALFDLVIFDEASQIAPWDAIGSIARGRQVVIAGDPRQMPPTSFFNRAAGATDADEATEEDMESILDECLAAGVPQHSLQWHYRSRHESLIAFSNNRYYENRLVTFPAPETRESAVSWRRVDGIYSKGIGRTNQGEAEAMVAETVRRLTDPAFVADGKTLAIVTLNADQQKLVEDLLDRARRSNPRIERFFAEDLAEPVVVKNLETVQGDERDLILLGIGYGPTEPGAPTMSMNFGPLNRDGGWRRLNVAVTRARQEMILFTSFNSSMIDLNRTSARAVRDLKHFIEFAEKGPRALAEAVQGSVGGHESPFEEAVAQALRRWGWTVVPQIGVSRFRIDLGIVHPDRPGDYLVGVECDGAAYHSAATARDRDKVRAAILEGLGWKLIRIWSTDWWVDKAGAAERLHRSIDAILEQSREQSAATHDAPEALAPGEEQGGIETVEEFELVAETEQFSSSSAAPILLDEQTPIHGISGTYQSAKFAPFADAIDRYRFYEPAYDETLIALIGHVLEHESPICDSLLVERIRRAHHFEKAGRIIRDRVMVLAKRHYHLTGSKADGAFVWPDNQSQLNWCQYRVPATEADIRQIEEIAPEELRAAASACVSDDHAVEIARLFGIRRLSSSARQRISRALAG